MVYDPYEYVPITYRAVTFFGGYRLLMKMIIFEKIQLKFYVSTKSIVIVIIELDILVVQVSSNLGCKGRSYLGDERYFLDKDDVSNKFIVIFIIDFEFFIPLLYDKLWGLPRRVFTLLQQGCVQSLVLNVRCIKK